jgi:hypothetical protein
MRGKYTACKSTVCATLHGGTAPLCQLPGMNTADEITRPCTLQGCLHSLHLRW